MAFLSNILQKIYATEDDGHTSPIRKLACSFPDKTKKRGKMKIYSTFALGMEVAKPFGLAKRG